MKPLARRLLPLVALLSVSSVPAQQPSAPPAAPGSPPLLQRDGPPNLTANVRAVILDVVVTDAKGQPVHGLTKANFTISEDGVTQRVDSLHEHVPAEQSTQMPKNPPNYFTNIMPVGNTDSWTVILIDAANNTPVVQSYVRSQLISFMKSVPPGHPIAIFQMDTTVHLIQGFSSDPAVLLQAVESKREQPAIPLVPIRERGYAPQQFRQDGLNGGLQAMGRYLAGFPGRKNLIWFSGAIPRALWGGGLGSPFPDVEDYTDELSETTDALALNRVAVYPIDARGLETDPTFSAANSGIPRNNSGAGFATRRFLDHSDIEDVAARTGGKAFYNTNGLKGAMEEVITAGSNYYTLAYTPTNRNWDGKHRSIKVEMSQSGLQLEYRHGYFARQETSQQSRRVAAMQRAAQAKASATQTEASYQPVKIAAGPGSNFEASMKLGAIPPTEVLFAVSVAPGTGTQKLEKNQPPPAGNYLNEDARKKPFRNYSILYAVDSKSLRFSTTPQGLHHGELVFVAVVYDDKGDVMNSIQTTRSFDLNAAGYKQALQGSIGIKQLIGVPAKGNYFFRFGVHDTVADHSGATEVPVDNVQLGVLGPAQQSIP